MDGSGLRLPDGDDHFAQIHHDVLPQPAAQPAPLAMQSMVTEPFLPPPAMMPAPVSAMMMPAAHLPPTAQFIIPQKQQQQQEQDEETDSEAAPVLPPPPQPPQPPVVHQRPPSAAGKSSAGGGRKGGRGGIITLKHLIDEGILQPGEDVLTVEYKGSTHVATLLSDGRIYCRVSGQQLTFDSPSAFSIFLKRLVNPTRKADDGWKTVKFRGRLLEQYKAELARKRLGEGGEDANGALAAMAALEPRAAKRLRPDGSRPETTKFRFGIGSGSLSNASVPDRPRRQRRAPPRFAAIGVDDEHALQPLEAYAPGQQPFTVRVSPAVEVVMDFHAHLCMNEVIGVLVGHWDKAARRIDILRALPVRELTTEDDSINVEMDPEDQVAKMEEALQLGLKVVGWYHSHPTFQAIPSTIDIYNQVLQQHAHREGGATLAEGHAEPYVAAIVSPYDRSNTSLASTINWFYVQHAPGAVPAEGQRPDEVGCIGKSLSIESLWEPLGQLENLPLLQKDMEQLAKRYAQMSDRANLEAVWVDGSSTRAEKLVNSLLTRLRPLPLDESKLSKFADKVLFSTRAVWNVYGKPAVLGGGVAMAAAAATAAESSGAVAAAMTVAPYAAAPGLPSMAAAMMMPSSAGGVGSVPVSAAVSEISGGGGEFGDTSEIAVGGGTPARMPHEMDEPISDADDDDDE